MRIKVVIIILIVFGIIFAANLLIDDRTLGPGQLEKVTVVCAGCHGSIPQYDAAIKVHDKHAAFKCIQCHSDVIGMETANKAHSSFEWLAAGSMLVILGAVIANILVVNRKGRIK